MLNNTGEYWQSAVTVNRRNDAATESCIEQLTVSYITGDCVCMGMAAVQLQLLCLHIIFHQWNMAGIRDSTETGSDTVSIVLGVLAANFILKRRRLTMLPGYLRPVEPVKCGSADWTTCKMRTVTATADFFCRPNGYKKLSYRRETALQPV